MNKFHKTFALVVAIAICVAVGLTAIGFQYGGLVVVGILLGVFFACGALVFCAMIAAAICGAL